MDESPLSRAWATLTRYPALVLVPILFDGLRAAVSWVGALLVGGGGGPAAEGGNIKFVLPPPLPSGTELMNSSPGTTLTTEAGLPGLLIGFLMLLLTAYVTGGFLHLLVGALNSIPPTSDRFIDGLNRFGGRLLLWNLVVGAVVLLGLLLGAALGPVVILLALIGIVAAVLLLLVPYLIVAEDMGVGEAVSQSPHRLMANLGTLIVVALISVLLSAGISFLLSAMNLQSLWLTAPLWGFVGTVLNLAVVAVVRPNAPLAA